MSRKGTRANRGLGGEKNLATKSECGGRELSEQAQPRVLELFPEFKAKFFGAGQSSKHRFLSLPARYFQGYAIKGFVVANSYRYSLSTAVFCCDDVIVDVWVDHVSARKTRDCQTGRSHRASMAKYFVARTCAKGRAHLLGGPSSRGAHRGLGRFVLCQRWGRNCDKRN